MDKWTGPDLAFFFILPEILIASIGFRVPNTSLDLKGH